MDINKKNQFWKLRKKHGRNKIFDSPEILWQEACKYFEWCENTPVGPDKCLRAYTLHGLCLHLGIVMSTWLNYKQRVEFKEVVERVEMLIYDMKFTGAAAGIFNASIIARDLGLVDKSEHTLQPKAAQDLTTLTDSELELYYELQKKIADGQTGFTRVIQETPIQLHSGIGGKTTLSAGSSIEPANG